MARGQSIESRSPWPSYSPASRVLQRMIQVTVLFVSLVVVLFVVIDCFHAIVFVYVLESPTRPKR